MRLFQSFIESFVKNGPKQEQIPKETVSKALEPTTLQTSLSSLHIRSLNLLQENKSARKASGSPLKGVKKGVQVYTESKKQMDNFKSLVESLNTKTPYHEECNDSGDEGVLVTECIAENKAHP